MKIRKTIGAGMTSFGLVLGLGGIAAATTGVIEHTGPDSYNKIEASSKHRVYVENDNDLDVDNDNEQGAFSGRAGVFGNTSGGSARSGDATNANSTSVTAHIDNSASSKAALGSGAGWGGSDSASIDTTGPDSYNKIELNKSSKVKVENNNDVDVDNDNEQFAKSGSAYVSHNTTGGSATSGDARNTNSTTVNVRLTN